MLSLPAVLVDVMVLYLDIGSVEYFCVCFRSCHDTLHQQDTHLSQHELDPYFIQPFYALWCDRAIHLFLHMPTREVHPSRMTWCASPATANDTAHVYVCTPGRNEVT